MTILPTFLLPIALHGVVQLYSTRLQYCALAAVWVLGALNVAIASHVRPAVSVHAYLAFGVVVHLLIMCHGNVEGWLYTKLCMDDKDGGANTTTLHVAHSGRAWRHLCAALDVALAHWSLSAYLFICNATWALMIRASAATTPHVAMELLDAAFCLIELARARNWSTHRLSTYPLTLRSAVKLDSGDAAGALDDAEAAIATLQQYDDGVYTSSAKKTWLAMHTSKTRSRARLSMGDVQGALEDAERAAVCAADADISAEYQADVHSWHGYVLDCAGNGAAALKALDLADKLWPGDLCILTHRALVRKIVLHDPRGALADLDSALTHLPQLLVARPTCTYLVRALRGRGALRANLNDDLAGAMEDLDAAVALAPTCHATLFVRAQIREHQGDLVGALSDVCRAHDARPGNQKIALMRAHLMCVLMQSTPSAVQPRC